MSAPVRTAVVTGAGRGIGAGITRTLLDAGLRVVAADVDEQALAELAEEFAGAADRLLVHRGDIADPQVWDDLVVAAHDRFGPVSVLVNNAAISPKRNGQRVPSHEMALSEWDRVLAVNITGAFLGFQATIGDMRQQGWGRIVNIASTAAQQGARVASIHYGVSKAGIIGLTRTLAWEYGGAGITVNAIAPGRILTPMAAGVSDEVNERMLAAIPVRRYGYPEDVAGAVAYLVSDAAGFVTGETLSVNGGAYMG